MLTHKHKGTHTHICTIGNKANKKIKYYPATTTVASRGLWRFCTQQLHDTEPGRYANRDRHPNK